MKMYLPCCDIHIHVDVIWSADRFYRAVSKDG